MRVGIGRRGGARSAGKADRPTDRPTEPTGLKKKKGTKKVGCMNACVPGGNRVTGFTFFCIAVVPLTRVLLTVDFAGGWAPWEKWGGC
jgi:hypothetical protein